VPKQAAGLSYAVRFPVLAKYFGQLCLVVAALTVVPLAVSLIHGETPIAFRYAIVIVVLAGTGGILGRIRPPPGEVQVNEAMEEDLVGGTKAHAHRVLVHSFRPGSRHGNRGSRGPADNKERGLGMYEG
jgi:hypothetical protein